MFLKAGIAFGDLARRDWHHQKHYLKKNNGLKINIKIYSRNWSGHLKNDSANYN